MFALGVEGSVIFFLEKLYKDDKSSGGVGGRSIEGMLSCPTISQVNLTEKLERRNTRSAVADANGETFRKLARKVPGKHNITMGPGRAPDNETSTASEATFFFGDSYPSP